MPPAPRLSAETRAAIAASTESIRVLAQRYGVNPKSIQRWRKRAEPFDHRPGPVPGRSSILSSEEETIIITFRQVTLLALDDCLYALQPVIPHLRRSALHRCLMRHGLSALPRPFHSQPQDSQAEIGHVTLFLSEAPTETGPCFLLASNERRTRFAFAAVHETDAPAEAGAFLTALIAAMPYRIDTVLTDPHPGFGFGTPFAEICAAAGIRHRIAPQPYPGLAQGQPDGFKYKNPQHLRQKLNEFIRALNYRRRLKNLGGLTPHEAMCAAALVQPERFIRDPRILNPTK